MNIVEKVIFQLSGHILIMLIGFITIDSVGELFYDTVLSSIVILHLCLIGYVNSNSIIEILKKIQSHYSIKVNN